MPSLTLRPQGIPFDHADSRYDVRPSRRKPFVATEAALARHADAIPGCLAQLQELARRHGGIDSLQVFTDPSQAEALWIAEDEDGSAILAILSADI